jgi:hypothetical protein
VLAARGLQIDRFAPLRAVGQLRDEQGQLLVVISLRRGGKGRRHASILAAAAGAGDAAPAQDDGRRPV